MNAAIQFTPQAVEDLDDIWWFIAADNHDAADRVEGEDESGERFVPEFWSNVRVASIIARRRNLSYFQLFRNSDPMCIT
jgi:hypothetical protein